MFTFSINFLAYFNYLMQSTLLSLLTLSDFYPMMQAHFRAVGILHYFTIKPTDWISLACLS